MCEKCEKARESGEIIDLGDGMYAKAIDAEDMRLLALAAHEGALASKAAADRGDMDQEAAEATYAYCSGVRDALRYVFTGNSEVGLDMLIEQRERIKSRERTRWQN